MYQCRELDHAMLRRLEKRILVGLPTSEARRVMFEHHLPPVICTTDSNGFELTSDLCYEALAEVHIYCFLAHDSMLSALYAISNPSVCHTGGSVENG